MTMNDLLRDIVPSGYRTALKKGIENGSVHIPLPEAGRLLEWLDSSRSVMEEAGTKNITIHTGYERRSIGLDVLFLDQMNSADIPQIQGWINNIPRYSEEESRARKGQSVLGFEALRGFTTSVSFHQESNKK